MRSVFLLSIILLDVDARDASHVTTLRILKSQQSVQYPRGGVLGKPFQAIAPLCAGGVPFSSFSFHFIDIFALLFAFQLFAV